MLTLKLHGIHTHTTVWSRCDTHTRAIVSVWKKMGWLEYIYILTPIDDDNSILASKLLWIARKVESAEENMFHTQTHAVKHIMTSKHTIDTTTNAVQLYKQTDAANSMLEWGAKKKIFATHTKQRFTVRKCACECIPQNKNRRSA